MYTEKDLNEDFDFLARKCHIFYDNLHKQNYDESCKYKEFNEKYYAELCKCFASLEKKYKPYFPELEDYKSYVDCDHEFFHLYMMLM